MSSLWLGIFFATGMACASVASERPLVELDAANVAKTVPAAATFLTADYGLCDPWHYDTPGMVSLGQRFAKAMKELEKHEPKESP